MFPINEMFISVSTKTFLIQGLLSIDDVGLNITSFCFRFIHTPVYMNLTPLLFCHFLIFYSQPLLHMIIELIYYSESHLILG